MIEIYTVQEAKATILQRETVLTPAVTARVQASLDRVKTLLRRVLESGYPEAAEIFRSGAGKPVRS